MGRLRYTVLCSLDGYVADRAGGFDWAVPDEEVLDHLLVEGEAVRTHVYGSRTYGLMTGWETDPDAAAQSDGSARFAEQFRGADKVVVSRTMSEHDVVTSRTRLVRGLDVGLVADVTAVADAYVNGPTLAATAFQLGLVRRVDVVLFPVVVGGGLAAFPPGARVDLVRTAETRFAGGCVHLGYDVRVG